MTAQPKMALEAEAKGPFVINLCSSTTPMALEQPRAPELKRFSFFVSRRRADGRDRFHLHMGHFMTLAEAEEWVNAVRDIYPGAWAGEAPGKKLAQRAAAGHAPQVSGAPAIPAITASAVQIAADAPELRAVPVARPAAPPAVAATTPPPISVPTLQAAPAPVAALVPVAAPTPDATVIQPKPIAATPVAPQARATTPTPAVKPPVAAPVAPAISNNAPKPSAQVPQRGAKPQPVPTPAPARKEMSLGSNVREVLKSLDDTAPTRSMPSPAPAAEAAPLTDTAVLKILEDRRVEPKPRGGEMAAKGIEMLRPDDSATVRALKDAVRDNEAVSFAVQLHWSVQPIDLAAVPPLAIFSAYTLYTVEGSRDGRKWYGLRLGFFKDAISAKQVASYVRSEFTSVAVIPVSTQERGRATENDPKAAGAPSASRPRHEPRQTEEFKLIEDKTDDVVSPSLLAAQAQMKPGKPAAKGATSMAKKKPLGRRVRASEKRAAHTLEETLEILGAGQLEMDEGRGELLNDSGVRHLRVEIQQPKNSAFSKLLDRLTERVKKA